MSARDDHAAVRPEPPRTYYDGEVKIPGYGYAPERCQGLTPVGFCEHGHQILGRSSCGTRSCPDHWRDSLETAVINKVAQLAAYRYAQEGADRRLSHVVASPPQDRRYSTRALWETRTEAYDALEDAGVVGGSMVVHPYRTNERGDNLFYAAAEHGDLDDGVGKWRFLREMSEDWADLTRYIEASPHYHTLAAGTDIRGEDAPEGWVVERIRSVGRFHLWDTESYREMVAPAYYMLTHGAVQQGRQGTTYFGEVASFNAEEELTATVWTRIQDEAERAVREKPGDPLGEPAAAGPEECPHDGCEAVVVDIVHLREYMEDEEFKSKVLLHGGRKRLLRLRGMFAWWDGRTDRPPPGVVTSEARFLEWLEKRGEVLTPAARQTSLPSVLAGR